jgi:Transposase IS4
MFAIELVDGKDCPPNIGLHEFEEQGKTVGLLLRLTRNLWGTGKVVVLYSGLCVLQGLIELRKKGVFAAAIVKKRRYWPKHIDGDGIKTHFEGKEVGDTYTIAGTQGGVPFHIMGMKEAPHVMTMMTTYGTLERTGN